ncbi:MAG: ABC transporter ATP-binding protein/permease [Acidobacteria bacterium]|nr:ABC transporter ATP-binding protein/permease [Acidobacteriota bacterium]
MPNRSNAKQDLVWFAAQVRPLLRYLILSMLLIALSSLMFLLDPLVLKWMVDVVLPSKDGRLLALSVAGLLIIYACRLGLFSVGRIVNFRSTQHLAFRMRLQLLEKINRLSADFHESTPVGEKLYRLEQDVDQVAEFGSLVPRLLQTVFNLLFVVVALALLNFRLLFVLVPLLLVGVCIAVRYQRRLRMSSEAAQERGGLESSFLQDHLASVIQVQLLNRESKQAETFRELAGARMDAVNQRNRVEVLFGTWYMAAIAIGTLAVLGYGGNQVFAGALSIGGLVAFYTYLARLFDPLYSTIDMYAQFTRVRASISRILDITERIPTVRDCAQALTLPRQNAGAVKLIDVTFAYPKRPPVLSHLTLDIAAGQKAALVGISGSGKSTIAKLIARLYDAQQGTVQVNGADVQNVKLKSLRANVCLLMQDTILFDRSLKENLLLACPDATDEQLQKTLEAVELAGVVARLPHGWYTRVGARGSTLSGGERQKVALARALLQQPAVLLLDEATSALDALSEQRILHNLSKHLPSQTIVFISHRLASFYWVHQIVMLHQGAIQEQGTHHELIGKGGMYARLARMGNLSEEPSAPPRESALASPHLSMRAD